MSIATKTGDSGSTGLMFNRRVPKTNPQVEAGGGVDELMAALGVARAAARDEASKSRLYAIQETLVILMGELATLAEDQARYRQQGFSAVTPAMTEQLDALVAGVESTLPRFKTWVLPGATAESAALDMARAVCRRAERRVCHLLENQTVGNREIAVYLNRLADLLWLWARAADIGAKS